MNDDAQNINDGLPSINFGSPSFNDGVLSIKVGVRNIIVHSLRSKVRAKSFNFLLLNTNVAPQRSTLEVLDFKVGVLRLKQRSTSCCHLL
ncbi:MAG: hypothetical protein DMF68_11040 [Acidobacteria bacterium]|nr:MAG: hypothetical protein DMF68_11040 [Acidobacteriota bacterium]